MFPGTGPDPDATLAGEDTEPAAQGSRAWEDALQRDLSAGRARLGRYLLLRKLGQGAMGVVYAAYDDKLDRKVAIKMLWSRGTARERARLAREAQAMARLSHPNVVLGSEHPKVASSLSELGFVRMEQGEYAAALADLERARAIEVAALGETHPHVMTTDEFIARVLSHLGQHDRAIELAQRIVDSNTATYGPDHHVTAAKYLSLASVFMGAKRNEEAREQLLRALPILEREYGGDNSMVAISLNNLAVVLCDLGQHEEALATLERLRAVLTHYAPDHPLLGAWYCNVGKAELGLGRWEAARESIRRGLSILEIKFGPEHSDLTSPLLDLGHARLELGDLDGAREALERAQRTAARGGAEAAAEQPAIERALRRVEERQRASGP